MRKALACLVLFGTSLRVASAQQPEVVRTPSKILAEKPVLGAMPLADVNWKLTQMGSISPEQAKKNQQAIKISEQGQDVGFGIGNLFGGNKNPPWKWTSHQFGFIPLLSTVSPSTRQLPVAQLGSVTPDNTLKTTAIRISLDRLRVAEYPGNGRHKILFTFQTQNKTGGSTEDVTFSQNYEVQQGQGAGIAGYPIFVDLNVPVGGLGLQCHTTNVSNDNDEKVLTFMNGSTYQSGLKLLDSVNPVVPVVSAFATGLLKDVESRNENVGVQDFYLGLDFGSTPLGARLAQGSYIVVQAPDDGWNWADWVFDVSKGQVVGKGDGKPIPYNYVVFSIQAKQS